MSRRARISCFAARFGIAYSFIHILWHYHHLYYHALLVSSVIEIGRTFTSLPPILAELTDDNNIDLKIGSLTFHPYLSRFTNATPIFISLMLSSSGVAFLSRLKTIFLGIGVLFIIQILSVFYQFYHEIYHSYMPLMKAGVDLWYVIEYDTAKAYFLKVSMHHLMVSGYIFPLCLWMILICILKRHDKSVFPIMLT